MPLWISPTSPEELLVRPDDFILSGIIGLLERQNTDEGSVIRESLDLLGQSSHLQMEYLDTSNFAGISLNGATE